MSKMNKNKYDIGIMGFWRGENYGSVLTNYALYNSIQELGKTVAMIEDYPTTQNSTAISSMDNFLYKYYNIVDYNTFMKSDELNNMFETFLLGSDQVLNPYNYKRHKNYLFFDFATKNKRKIAYASSFGYADLAFSIFEKLKLKYFLKDFDAISVREDSALEILNDLGLKGTQVLDPILICPMKYYEKLIETVPLVKENSYILNYILNPNNDKRKLLIDIAKKLDKKNVNILDGVASKYETRKKKLNLDNIKPRISLPEFLSYYKNADFIVTDSFHGTILAILFKKNFISLPNKGRGMTRFESLSHLLNIENRMLVNLNEIQDITQLINTPVDFDAIHNKIEVYRKASETWLQNMLDVQVKQRNISLKNRFMRKIFALSVSDKYQLVFKTIEFLYHKSMAFITMGKIKQYNENCANSTYQWIDYIKEENRKQDKNTVAIECNSQAVLQKKCCGCGSCFNICPVGAISMQENNEGFLFPVINKKKCINCGLCLKSCPVLNTQDKNSVKPECYAAMANDEIRMKSSSGGMFTILAEYILDKGGYVCGAAFRKDWSVHHIIVDNKEDLSKLRGSKYIQSDIEKCYSEIKKLLDNDKYVLFSGCPCQVAGLYAFLKTDYEKLLTIDLLCHGAPSPGIWHKYLREYFNISKIKDINFRDKAQIGWRCSHCSITTKNNNIFVTNDYTKLFHESIILRQSCENCSFSKIPRPADITLGDFWKIKNYNETLNDGKGLSLVLTNSEKGKYLYSEITKNNISSTKIDLNEKYNNGNLRRGAKLNPSRTLFFDLVQKCSYKKTLSKFYKVDNNVDFLQRIFSVKNSKDKRHKVVTMLGIKIKFKRG